MGFGGTSIDLRPQAGRRQPSKRELLSIHRLFHQSFYSFTWHHLSRSARDYLKKVIYFESESIELEQSEALLGEEKLWRLTWWVYSHQTYAPFEHWLPLFLAHNCQASSELAQQKKFEIVLDMPTLPELLLVKPDYQYITLDRGFYLLPPYDREVLCLQAAPNTAAIAQGDILPLNAFTPEEQHRIQQVQQSEVCQCSICVALRPQLDL